MNLIIIAEIFLINLYKLLCLIMYCKNLIIFAAMFVGVASQGIAKNNFTRILPRSFPVQVQHPDTKNFSLTITNSTDKEIVFRNCNFDCDCIEIISYSKNNKKCDAVNIKLAPEDVLSVKFKLDSKFYTQPKVLPIYFYFNNLVPAVQIVKVVADIKSNIIPKPESLTCIIPQGFKGKIGSFALKIKNKNIKVDSVKSNVDSINAKYNPGNNAIDIYVDKPLIGNTSAWLNVQISRNPPLKGVPEGRGMLSQCGTSTDKVSQIAHTDHKPRPTDHGPRITDNRKKQKSSSQRKLLLHIREIKIISDLYAVPATIDFGVISKPGEIVGKEIMLKSRTDTPWKITGSQIKGKNKNAVKRKILPQTNKTVNVLWAILDGKILPGLIDTEIIINTDHPYTKQITIPVNGQVLALNKKNPENSKNHKKVKK